MQTASTPASAAVAEEARFKDYSLVGRDTALAIERGLAEADWYISPVPRDVLRELLERQDGPAVRDTLLYFGLLLATGVATFALWGSWWAYRCEAGAPTTESPCRPSGAPHESPS